MFTRKIAISAAFIGVAAFAFGAIGGGGNKGKTRQVSAGYTPVKTTQGYTLKSGPGYHRTLILNEEKSRNSVTVNSLVAYRNGNTTYILPNRYKLNTSCQQQTRSNLQLLQFKLKFGK
jgi:hypothetical protein